MTIVRPWAWTDAPTAEDVTAGQYIRPNTTSGKLELGNATSSTEVGNIAFVAATSANSNLAVTGVKRGILDVGDALASMNFGDIVYLSDVDGTFADTPGTVSKSVGYVVPGWAAETADKLFCVDL